MLLKVSLILLMVSTCHGGNENQHITPSTERSISNSISRPIYLSPGSDIDQGPAYLASMINQLNTERNKIMGPTPVPDDYDHPPPLPHKQLSTLYNNAVNKLKDIDLNKLPTDPDEDPNNTSPGYYYYYFPITDMPGGGDQESDTETSTDHMLMMMDDNNGAQVKQVEPLFVAIASFIGISTLFAFSVLFLPKFGSHRKRSETSNDGLTRTVMEALEDGPEKRTGEPSSSNKIKDEDEIEMKGCKARIACEFGRALRRLHMHQGPLRALERILPSTMGKQVQRVRESAHRRDKCSTIRCHSQ